MNRSTIVFLSLAGALVATLLLWYHRMGGFNTPKVQHGTEGPFFIGGLYYEGRVKDPAMGTLFDTASALVLRKEVEGTLAAHFLNDPNKDEGRIKAFIGIVKEDSLSALPTGWTWKVIPSSEAVKGSIEAHYLLAPFKVYPAMEEYAKGLNKKLREQSLEIYPSEREVVVISDLE